MSGEGGRNGTFNEWRFFNGIPDSTELTITLMVGLGIFATLFAASAQDGGPNGQE